MIKEMFLYAGFMVFAPAAIFFWLGLIMFIVVTSITVWDIIDPPVHQ